MNEAMTVWLFSLDEYGGPTVAKVYRVKPSFEQILGVCTGSGMYLGKKELSALQKCLDTGSGDSGDYGVLFYLEEVTPE